MRFLLLESRLEKENFEKQHLIPARPGETAGREAELIGREISTFPPSAILLKGARLS
jgi:hypothetical protein